MRCAHCGHRETLVIDSRPAEGGAVIRRRRVCVRCAGRFNSYERPAARREQRASQPAEPAAPSHRSKLILGCRVELWPGTVARCDAAGGVHAERTGWWYRICHPDGREHLRAWHQGTCDEAEAEAERQIRRYAETRRRGIGMETHVCRVDEKDYSRARSALVRWGKRPAGETKSSA